MSNVWENGPRGSAETMVLLALADYSNDEGECWPSVQSIATKARMTDRGVQKIMTRLVEAGWLEVDAGGGRRNCNLYRIKTPNHVHPELRSPPNVVAETPNLVPKTPEPRSPEPSLTIIEPSKKETRDARDIIAELMSVVSEETASAFIDHRKAKRAKLTWYAANLIAKKLAGHPNPDAVLLTSIENGWTGVFPDKQKPKEERNGNSKGERRLQSWLAGSAVAPRVDSWPDTDPSQPLLARR